MRVSQLSLLLLALSACRTGDKADDTGGAGGAADAVDADGDGFLAAEDCDDADEAVHPGATELCNGVDDDCDDQVDEDVLDTWYADADGDGYGDPAAAEAACERPASFVDAGTDCDDGDAAVHPAATEVCNELDDDCDGEVDEGVQGTWYADADEDGYGDAAAPVAACEAPPGFVADATDCDDTEAGSHPGAVEVCDEQDNDCDGAVDEEVTTTFYADTDGDGYGDVGTTVEACAAPSGFTAGAGDCDDDEAAVSPAATETCNGVDDDCDGATDEADAADAVPWYTDSDGDGYGDGATGTPACAAPSGTVADASDCDDGDAAVNPAAAEVCNGVDDDCDGDTDDADASVDLSTGSTFFTDADGDGYGDAASSAVACARPAGTVADDSDCDDGDAAVNPGATEACNGDDDDCDGGVDEGLLGAGGSCPASSCAAVLADQPSATDGSYWLEGTGGSLFEGWCDMSRDGGGWTLVGSVVNDGSRSWDSYAVWTDATTFGAYATAQSADHKSVAFSEVAGDDLLVASADYDFAFHTVLGALSFAGFVAAEYDSTACSTSYLADGVDWSDGLSADQAAATNLIVRPLDDNANCFPGQNEMVIVGFQAADCCWVGGVGNTPGGQASWRTHDGSVLQAASLNVASCTAGAYPCNANAKVFTQASFCYDTSCKQTWAELYVR